MGDYGSGAVLGRGSGLGEQALALGDEAPGQEFLAHLLVAGAVEQHLQGDAVALVSRSRSQIGKLYSCSFISQQ